MALYQYDAFDATGKKKSGLVDAQGERDAKDKLREQGIMVSKITLKKTGSSKENLKGENLLTFTIQLSQLVNAGIPLYESLVAIEEQYRTEAFHRIILSLCDQIKAGVPLSQAMGAYPDSFDKLYCSMITAGESVGALNVVLDKLALLLVKQNKMKRQIGTALIYPSILVCFALVVIGLLLGFVIPSIEGIFGDKKLNNLTRFVIGASHFARDYWWLYLPAIVGIISYLYYKIRSPVGRLWIQRYGLKVPLIRNLMIQASVARFCRTMGTLQQGGLPMIDSLQIAREVMGNVVLEDVVKKAEEKIVEGSSLSAELIRSPLFPPMVSRMMSVGEDSGTLVTMLNKIADIYEEEVEKTIDRIMELSQPVILIFMGGVIGCVLMAILLPLTDVSAISTD